MFRHFQSNTVRTLLLALLLVVAQALLMQHQADLAQHAGNDHCEWCLTHTPLTGTLTSAGLPVWPPADPVAPRIETPVVTNQSFHPLYASRAPPFSLST